MQPSGRRRGAGSSTVSAGWRLPRAWWETLVFPAAVLMVHQLRYLLAYGSHASSQLNAHGDRYVVTGGLITGALVVVSLGVAVCRLVGASQGRGDVDGSRAPWWLLWLGLTLLLLAGFCVLEGLELVFEPHRAGGLLVMFGSGGWWALPAAAFVGMLMALLVHGGRALLLIASGRRVPQRISTASPRRYVSGGALPRRPMATGAAGRAPPVTTAV